MSSPRGRAAPGRAERRDGRRRSASIPWRRGRPEGSRERASGGWRGEAWGLRVAAGGRGLDGPLELPGHGRFPAALFRLQCPSRCAAGCRPCPLLLPRRSPSPAAIGRPGGAAPLASRALQACTATRSRDHGAGERTEGGGSIGSCRFLEGTLLQG